MAKFNVVSRDSAAFDNVAKTFAESSERFDYDGMASAYNSTEQGGFLTFEHKKGKSSIVSAQLERRGLQRGVDFDVKSRSVANSDTAVIMIERVTEKDAGPAPVVRRGRPPVQAEAEAEA